MFDIIESTAFGAAIVLGFRHGFDWDHIAALTDLTGSQTSSRRSMLLATLYALGHAVMVILLGVAAIVFGGFVPDSVDSVMERLVGVTLVALGLYLTWSAIRLRGAAPLRSRWMLLLTALRSVVRRRRNSQRMVAFEHTHPHDHDHPSHVHHHGRAVDDVTIANRPDRDTSRVAASIDVATVHTHPHRHLASMPADPFVAYGAWSSFGVGLLHGVGAETPTQVLIFAAAAKAGGAPTSLGLLACFVVGVVAANTVVAAAGTFGLKGLAHRRTVMLAFTVLTAVFSILVGTLLLVGRSSVLPAILGG
jgi:hypothetical protein